MKDLSREEMIEAIRASGMEDEFSEALIQTLSQGLGRVFQDGVVLDLGGHDIGIDGPELVIRILSATPEEIRTAFQTTAMFSGWLKEGTLNAKDGKEV